MFLTMGQEPAGQLSVCMCVCFVKFTLSARLRSCEILSCIVMCSHMESCYSAFSMFTCIIIVHMVLCILSYLDFIILCVILCAACVA